MRLALRPLVLLALLMLPLPLHAEAFQLLSQGAVVHASVGTTPVGDFLLGEIGGQSLGIRTLDDRRWLVQWEGLAAFKGGELAAAHPYTPLLGGHGLAMGEVGYRFVDETRTPYVSLRIAGDMQFLLPPGKSLSDLRKINSIDGVGGMNLRGAVRLSLGESAVGRNGLAILAFFVQESLRGAEVNTPSAAFTDVGGTLQAYLFGSWLIRGEILRRYRPTQTTPKLGMTDAAWIDWQTTEELRKVFANGMWFGANFSYSAESDVVTYSNLTLHTSSAPSVVFGVQYGFPIGPQEWK